MVSSPFFLLSMWLRLILLLRLFGRSGGGLGACGRGGLYIFFLFVWEGEGNESVVVEEVGQLRDEMGVLGLESCG